MYPIVNKGCHSVRPDGVRGSGRVAAPVPLVREGHRRLADPRRQRAAARHLRHVARPAGRRRPHPRRARTVVPASTLVALNELARVVNGQARCVRRVAGTSTKGVASLAAGDAGQKGVRHASFRHRVLGSRAVARRRRPRQFDGRSGDHPASSAGGVILRRRLGAHGRGVSRRPARAHRFPRRRDLPTSSADGTTGIGSWEATGPTRST